MIAVTGREPYPAIPLLDPGVEADPKAHGYEPALITEYYEARREAILLAQADPLRYGYEPPAWGMADKQIEELREAFPHGVVHLFVPGGNRAAKSRWAAKRVVQSLIRNPGSRWWCGDATESSSRANQQRYIWDFLPPEWKNEKTGKTLRTKTTKINYSVAGGFTENIFVLPNGSECEFKFYEQKIGSLQAVELSGFWGDELLPLDWIETLEYRLVNKDGLFLLTFTPVEGYTQTVGYYLDEGKVLKEVDAELLPKFDGKGKEVGYEKVPRIVQCKRANARVVYFHTRDNPFGNYEGMKAQVRAKSKDQILMRVYGVCTKAAHVQFPMFKDSVHVISANRYEQLVKANPPGPRYHLVDPCSGRNWFMLWMYCPSPDKYIIYREWPSHGHLQAYVPGVGDPGEWALPGEPHDGLRGPAQEPFGFGLERYREEIKRVEGDEVTFERWMDSRSANMPKEDREGTTTLIQQMNELGLDFIPMTAEKSILNNNDGSLDLINSALYYDEQIELGKFSANLARINEPALLITENCPNTIYAMRTWTGRDGQRGACKDPIDCLRGAFLSELSYVDNAMLGPKSDWHAAHGRR